MSSEYLRYIGLWVMDFLKITFLSYVCASMCDAQIWKYDFQKLHRTGQYLSLTSP